MWGVTTGAITLPVHIITLPCLHARHRQCAGGVEMARAWGRGRTVAAPCGCACHVTALLQ